MDAHRHYIFTALRALLAAALTCAPADEALRRALKAALVHVGKQLKEQQPT